jgi:hypothetical protein
MECCLFGTEPSVVAGQEEPEAELTPDEAQAIEDFSKPQRYYINPAAVLNLHISDTVNDWVVDGSITLLYLPEGAPLDLNSSHTGQSKQTATTGSITQAAAEKLDKETKKVQEEQAKQFDMPRKTCLLK